MSDLTEAEVDPQGRYIRYNEELGRGAFKVVYRAIDREQGLEVAWNQVRLEQGTDFVKLWKEILILQQLQHPNIIQFHHSWIDEAKLQVVFITEWMTSGTLKQFIHRAKVVKLKVIKNWCVQILEGLHYLHTRDPPIIHRDIKCDNIFINGALGQVKIGDLGLATILTQSGARLKQSIIGTPEFMAPEYYDEKYDEKVDIYAFGMSLLEMATQEYPYSECDNAAQVFKKVSTGQKPRALYKIADAEVFAFIDDCLQPHQYRMSAAELLQHPFLQNIDDESNNREIQLRSEEDTDAFMERCRTSGPPPEFIGLSRRRPSSPRPLPVTTTVPEPSPIVMSETSATVPTTPPLALSSEVLPPVTPGELAPTANTESAPPIVPTECAPPIAPAAGEMVSVEVPPVQPARDPYLVGLRFNLSLADGQVTVIEFDYNIAKDTPEQVAMEMVRELQLPQDNISTIASTIRSKVESYVHSHSLLPMENTPNGVNQYTIIDDSPEMRKLGELEAFKLLVEKNNDSFQKALLAFNDLEIVERRPKRKRSGSKPPSPTYVPKSHSMKVHVSPTPPLSPSPSTNSVLHTVATSPPPQMPTNDLTSAHIQQAPVVTNTPTSAHMHPTPDADSTPLAQSTSTAQQGALYAPALPVTPLAGVMDVQAGGGVAAVANGGLTTVTLLPS